MDLGATVCLPASPSCGECPVAAWCAGPDVYEPPRSQGRFTGSDRQVRGAVLRELLPGPLAIGELTARTGFAAERVAAGLRALAEDDLVACSGEVWAVAG